MREHLKQLVRDAMNDAEASDRIETHDVLETLAGEAVRLATIAAATHRHHAVLATPTDAAADDATLVGRRI